MGRGSSIWMISLLASGIAGCGSPPAPASGATGPGSDARDGTAADPAATASDAAANAPDAAAQGPDAAASSPDARTSSPVSDAEEAGVDGAPRVQSDARPDGTGGNDDFLACPVGCTIDACQRTCSRDVRHVSQTPDHRVIEYRGQVSISRRPGDRSALRCGTYDEQQNCGTCWGSNLMDVQLPRVALFAENVTVAGQVVHRVHIRYSWDALDPAGHPLANFNPLTAIISRQDLRVVDPATGNAISTASVADPSFVNPGRTPSCPMALPAAQDHRAFDLDLPVLAATPDAIDIIELTTVGNYE
jgi:hypothetical protein